MRKTIIAFVGEMASGKGLAAELLAKRGYSLYVLSARVKEQLVFQGIPETRETKIRMANRLREEYGTDALMEMTDHLVREDPNSRIIIDGIRNEGEIDYLQNEYGENNVFVIGIKADFETQWERLQKRGREGDPKTREEFERLIKFENGEGQKQSSQQIAACMRRASLTIENKGNSSVELGKRLKAGLVSLGIEGQTRQKERR